MSFVGEMIEWNMLWLVIAVRLGMSWYGERDVEVVSDSDSESESESERGEE